MRAAREGEVLTVSATGTITVESAKTLRTFLNGELEGQDARAVLCDLRGAVHLVTDEGWLEIREHSLRASPRVPVALLVVPGGFGVARAHCRRMAAHGFLRQSFCERAPALSWCARRTEHWEWLPASAPS